jgi:hypothetical protein
MSMPSPNMFNTTSEQQKQSLWTPPSVDPRISFSNDFADIQQPAAAKQENIYREAPVSSEFEFCAENYTMISADEVFFQGMLLPAVKSINGCCSANGQQRKMTLRDELLAVDDDYDDVVFPRMPKNSSRWRERLGLRKGKKYDKADHREVLETVAEEKMMPAALVHHEEVFVSKKTQVIKLKTLDLLFMKYILYLKSLRCTSIKLDSLDQMILNHWMCPKALYDFHFYGKDTVRWLISCILQIPFV